MTDKPESEVAALIERIKRAMSYAKDVDLSADQEIVKALRQSARALARLSAPVPAREWTAAEIVTGHKVTPPPAADK